MRQITNRKENQGENRVIEKMKFITVCKVPFEKESIKQSQIKYCNQTILNKRSKRQSKFTFKNKEIQKLGFVKQKINKM